LNLIVDIGNTRIKFALFDGQTLLFKGVGEKDELVNFMNTHSFANAIVSSVREKDEITELIKEYKVKQLINLSLKTKLPINNLYESSETLGDDRLANVVGANSLFLKKNVLVIDAGTCIKFDAVTKDKKYRGGALSPGLAMRFKALNYYTGKLPIIEAKNNVDLIGTTSENSILSGVVNGIMAEIHGVIAQYQSIYENLTVILTGGDTTFFETELKSNIFAEPNLTLIGLNEILRFNTSD